MSNTFFSGGFSAPPWLGACLASRAHSITGGIIMSGR